MKKYIYTSLNAHSLHFAYKTVNYIENEEVWLHNHHDTMDPALQHLFEDERLS